MRMDKKQIKKVYVSRNEYVSFLQENKMSSKKGNEE